MRVIIKIVLSIVLFIICIPLSAMGNENPTLKLLVLAGLVGGLIAIWKYKPKDESEDKNDNDQHFLDKTT